MSGQAMDLVYTPLASAAIGYAGSRWVLQNSGTILVGNTAIDKNLGYAALIGAGSLVAEVTRDYVIPKIPLNTLSPGLQTATKIAIPAAIAGGSAVAFEKLATAEPSGGVASLISSATPNQASMAGNFAVGAASYALGSYVSKQLRGVV